MEIDMQAYTAPFQTFGSDNGLDDLFLADVEYQDGSIGRVAVYGRNMQCAYSLIKVFAEVYKFAVLRFN